MSNIITTPHLRTHESPRRILEEDFPKHKWPISGGWGYDENDPVIIELDSELSGVPFEQKFIEYRTYEELVIFRPRGKGFAGISVKAGLQSLLHVDGKQYDVVEYTVTAWPEDVFKQLKNDFESHNRYVDDKPALEKYLEHAASLQITYKTKGCFDISRFFGKC